MKRIEIGFFLMLFGYLTVSSVEGNCSTIYSRHNVKSRYDNYRIYQVFLSTQDHIDLFNTLEKKSDSMIFIGHAKQTNQTLTILVAPHKIPELSDLLTRYSVSYEIINYNFQENIDKESVHVMPSNATGDQMDWKHYFQMGTIFDWFGKLIKEFPTILTTINIGTTSGGFPIWGVKLSRKEGNTGVFVEGGIHAREWISPAAATFILNQLLRSEDPAIKEISTNFDWYIFPIVNPEGYTHTFTGDRMWRKNRQLYGDCRGVDLNRNFGYQWNTVGTSKEPCDYDFSGGSANSEAETKAIVKFIESNVNSSDIRTYFALHSYSQLVMFPYGHTSDRVPNYNDLLAMGEKAVTAMESRYGTKYKTGAVHDIIYPVSGASTDWAYSEMNIPIPFTFELRGLPSSPYLFLLDADMIEPTAWEALEGVMAILQEAKKRGYYN